MDHLEQYIRENLKELDQIEPVDADGLWERIQAPRAQVRPPDQQTAGSGWRFQIGRNWKLTAAAAVFLAFGIAAWLNFQPNNASDRKMASLTPQDYYPEIIEEEMIFLRTIAKKEADLGIGHLDKQQFIDVFNELDELEKIHRQQLKDLPEVFDNEEWVSTLMQYYEQKLRILEHLSREIDKQKQIEERQHARSI